MPRGAEGRKCLLQIGAIAFIVKRLTAKVELRLKDFHEINWLKMSRQHLFLAWKVLNCKRFACSAFRVWFTWVWNVDFLSHLSITVEPHLRGDQSVNKGISERYIFLTRSDAMVQSPSFIPKLRWNEYIFFRHDYSYSEKVYALLHSFLFESTGQIRLPDNIWLSKRATYDFLHDNIWLS